MRMSLITAPAQMRMILIYTLAKRDQISGSGRPNFASGRIFRVQYALIQGWNGAVKGAYNETKMLDLFAFI